MSDKPSPPSGRGTTFNPKNRFLQQETGDPYFDDPYEEEANDVKTTFIEVHPKTIVNKVSSPDVGMMYSLNPYQGCEHGCTYCYARPTHEYWGYSAGLDFERTILVKKNAPELLRAALMKRSHVVHPISLSGNTDCYQPCEREYRITRQLLEIMLEFRHPVSLITKNALILRDIDLLEQLAELNLVSVYLSITSLDENLRRKLEPRTATARRRLHTLEQLTTHGIPARVMIAPLIPAINDMELFSIVKAAGERGASGAGYIVVRLNGPNAGLFDQWLQYHFPERREKVLHQLSEIHGGSLGDSRFGTRMRGEGNYALNMERQFKIARNRFLTGRVSSTLRKDLFRRPDSSGQLELF